MEQIEAREQALEFDPDEFWTRIENDETADEAERPGHKSEQEVEELGHALHVALRAHEKDPADVKARGQMLAALTACLVHRHQLYNGYGESLLGLYTALTVVRAASRCLRC
jgi:hypothetical protein